MKPQPSPIRSIHGDKDRGRRDSSLPRAGARLTLVVVLATACGTLPNAAFPDFGDTAFGAAGTLPPMPTIELPEFDSDLLAPVFSLPEIPEGTLQPLVGSPPDWWHLVPIHHNAYAAGSNGRNYHYVVALPTDDMTAFYEQAMRQGGWETYVGTIPSGSASMMSYWRDGTTATIYISSHDGGSLVSIIIE